MADTKISGLPASTTPLAGTEELPIVQSGVTRKVSVANLTAGRAISATQLTLTTGNVIVADGQGIDFSATPGTGTSELLDDYEEGTWALTVTPGSGAFTSVTPQVARYTKIGNTVVATFRYTVANAGTAGSNVTISLPFTAVGQDCGTFRENAVTGQQGSVAASAGAASAIVRYYDNSFAGGTGVDVAGTITYTV